MHESRGFAVRYGAVVAEIDVGRKIAGKYELLRLIGKGAMGEVWLATHDTLGGQFAIKLVQPGERDVEDSIAGRFQLEAQISAKLSRKTRHIVSVSDHGEEDGLAYLVMEALEGESFLDRIARGALSLEETVAVVAQIARALGYAHDDGIFHRDLKPANVFLTKDEDGRLLVKLLDFGIARNSKPFASRSPFATAKDMVMGTPSYMSPEQARALDTLDYRCDVWALAVVAYESLTQRLPWAGESVEEIFLNICTHRAISIREHRAELPPAIESVFGQAFAERLDDRFRTAAKFADALATLVDPRAVQDAAGAVVARRDVRDVTDMHGVAIGEAAILVHRTRRPSSWMIVAVAALVAIGLIAVGLRSLTSRDAATKTTPPDNPTPSAVASVAAPPATEPVPPPAPTTTKVTTTIAPTPKAPARPSPPATDHTATHVATAATGATAPPPPPATVGAPPPATVGAPPPTPNVPDKSGVF